MANWQPALVLAASAVAIGATMAAAGSATAPSPERQAELIYRVEQDCGSCHGLTMKGGLGPAFGGEQPPGAGRAVPPDDQIVVGQSLQLHLDGPRVGPEHLGHRPGLGQAGQTQPVEGKEGEVGAGHVAEQPTSELQAA